MDVLPSSPWPHAEEAVVIRRGGHWLGARQREREPGKAEDECATRGWMCGQFLRRMRAFILVFPSIYWDSF